LLGETGKRARRANPDQVEPGLASRDEPRAGLIGLDAGRDHLDPVGMSPGFERAIGKEGISRDHEVGHLDDPFESLGPASMVRPPAIVGVAIEHGVVEVEDQAIGSLAEFTQLPAWQKFPLK
jgi:hypothetical protein